jgi:hypothetical protein
MMIWRSLDPRVIASLLVRSRRWFFVGRTLHRDGTSMRPSRARVSDERASARPPIFLCSCNRNADVGTTSRSNNHETEGVDTHGTRRQ